MLSLPTKKVLENACASMPLFPLPSVVLFPNTILRLHVFEPRYVQLLKDCMSGNQLMAIPMLKMSTTVEPAPPIHSVSGMGMVVHCEELEDDRYNIVLLGLSRINILEEIPSEKMYRIAKAELISEGREDGDFDLSSIQTLLAQVIVQNPKLSGSLEVLLQEDLSADKVLDILAHLLVQETYQRQKFMEKFSLKERASLIEGVLAELLMRGNSITE